MKHVQSSLICECVHASVYICIYSMSVGVCICFSGMQANFMHTAAVGLLVTSIQTVIISVTFPRSPYAAMIMALELITFTSLWLQTSSGDFWEKKLQDKLTREQNMVSLSRKYVFRGQHVL